MENMENNVMNGDVMVDGATDAVNAGLGRKVAAGLLIGAGIGLVIKGTIVLGKKIKNAVKSKKANKTDVVVEDYEEVPCEEA